MSSSTSTSPHDVLHGPRSWIDHDRPWLLQRQFLVTDYQASIMSNLVAIALTLSGPRLWILIKRLGFCVYGTIFARRSVVNELSQAQSSSNALDIIEESHSVLSAAIRPFVNSFYCLRPRIELPSATTRSNVDPRCSWPYEESVEHVVRAWGDFLKRPLDTFISVCLSIAFVALFVAGSSGTVLSTGIVSDNTALASSTWCSPFNRSANAKSTMQAFEYIQRC